MRGTRRTEMGSPHDPISLPNQAAAQYVAELLLGVDNAGDRLRAVNLRRIIESIAVRSMNCLAELLLVEHARHPSVTRLDQRLAA